MDRFVAIDVETANENRSSICQIGIAVFEGGELVATSETLVNPETYFLPLNVGIHGITPEMIAEAPRAQEIKAGIQELLSNEIVVSYSMFDHQAISSTFGVVNYSQWLDVAGVVRRTWENFSYKGYGLGNVSSQLGIENKGHHNALNDAIVCGYILLRAMEEKETNLEDMIKLCYRSIKYIKKRHGLAEIQEITEPNKDGAFYGEAVAFTGNMSWSREQLTNMAYQAGFDVKGGISKKVDILVQGQQDMSRISGLLSGKEKKAFDLIKKGHDMKIISDKDFVGLILGDDL